MHVYLNGKLLAPDQAASLSVHDAGLQHGVGVFETMAAFKGTVFRLAEHLDRLLTSAQQLGLAVFPSEDTLAEAVRTAIAARGGEDARVRLTVTPGPLSLLATSQEQPEPTVLVVVTEPTQYDADYFNKGVLVTVAGALANPFDPVSGHKTLAYWGRLLTLRQAAALGAGETLWLNSATQHLASGAVSNVFLVKDGKLKTPIARGEEVAGSAPAPVLPGITRQAVIEIAESQGIEVERCMLDINEMLDADEVFLTNSSWQLLPVHSVEKHAVGDGKVGPMAQRMRGALLKMIKHETS